MSSGDWKPGCPNCPCPSCRPPAYQLPPGWIPAGTVTPVGADASECAYDRIAKDYAARGEPMPQFLHLYCPCRRCNPICM